MRKLILRVVFFSFAIIMFSGATNFDVAANPLVQTEEDDGALNGECYGLDTLFIIDQSKSMSGAHFNEASDPTEQREYAVEAAVDQLSDLGLDRCPDTTQRIAMVSFAGYVEEDFSFKDINPSTTNESRTIRETLADLIDAKVLDDDSFVGGTDPKIAFISAKEMFDDLPLTDEGEIRKRVIIFISDGQPSNVDEPIDTYVENLEKLIAQNFPFDENLLKRENCLDSLRDTEEGLQNASSEEINTCIAHCPEAECDYQGSTYIWMILLHTFEGYSRGVIDTYQTIAEDHGGALIELTENAEDIPSTFRGIISKLAGVEAALLDCGKFIVNPYLRKATLNIYKLDAGNNVTISYVDEQNQRHEIVGGVANTDDGFDLAEEWYAFGTNERYVFNYPYPGFWDLRADDCSGLDAYYEEINIDAGYEHRVPSQIAQYDREPYYDSEDPFYMEVQMIDENGQIIKQADHSRFEVHTTALVTLPDDTTETYDMEWVPEESIFRSIDPIRVPIPGMYSIDVVGKTYRHEGEPTDFESESYSSVFAEEFELFRLEDAEFNVFPVTPFQIEILSPESGAFLGAVHEAFRFSWPLDVQSIRIGARIVDSQGNPLSGDISEVLENYEDALHAHIVGFDSTNEILTYNPDTGEYWGSIRNFEEEGEHTIVVSLATGYDETYRPLNLEESVEFSRQDGIIHRANFYKSLLWGVIGMVGLRIGLCILSNRNPVSGDLVFYDGMSDLCTFSLGVGKLCGKSKRTISKKELNPYLQLGLKKVTARVQKSISGARGRETMDDGDGLYFAESLDSGHPGITIKFWPNSGERPYTIDLNPNVKTTFSEHGVLQIKYIP